jgi:hypothetical protein
MFEKLRRILLNLCLNPPQGNFDLSLRKVSVIHETKDGAVAVIVDDKTQELFLLQVRPIQSAMKVEKENLLMFEDLLKIWGTGKN